MAAKKFQFSSSYNKTSTKKINKNNLDSTTKY